MTRLLTFCVGLSAFAGLLPAQVCPPQCALQRPSSASAAYTLLMNGNQRFNSNCNVTKDCVSAPLRGDCRRSCTANAQSPFAIVLSCADSRVPPELLFDQGIGDLFIVRVAGNLATTEAKGSIEYALAKFNPKPNLLLVLGHTDCGAARTAIEYQPPAAFGGSLELFSVFAPIFRSVGNCRDYGGNSCITDVVGRNVNRVVADLAAFKPVIDARPGLGVAGWVYSLAPGRTGTSSITVVQALK